MEAAIKTLATKDDISNARKEASETRAEMIKWMFIFWASQFAVILSIFFMMLKK